MSDSDFYRNRAICRKILAEGTGLVPERMTEKALKDRLDLCIEMLILHATDMTITSPPLARAVADIDRVFSELFTRTAQQMIPLSC